MIFARYFALPLALALAGCASLAPIARDGTAAVPLRTAATDDAGRDLRGAFRAALCARPAVGAAKCAEALHRLKGELPAPRPPAARPHDFRLLFVPGFLATCFPGIASYTDVIEAARSEGFDAQVLAVGGRNSVAANARLIAAQIDALPDDGRRIVIFGHSKGALDALQMLVDRPDLASRTTALVTIAGAVNGSPLADRLRSVYRATVAESPLLRCERGEGDALEDLRPDVRRDWWARHRAQLRVPLYAIVTMPDAGRISPALALVHLGLAAVAPYNDGQIPSDDQVAPGAALLGFVNADHLTVVIPRPQRLPWAYLVSTADFPRADVMLAAVDVIASDAPATVAHAFP